jgi:hypothetical protein
MKVLLVHFQGFDTSQYRGKLTSWGIEVETLVADMEHAWSGTSYNTSWLTTFLARVYEQDAETVDVVQFVYPAKLFRTTNRRAVGIHYRKTYSGYQHCHVKYRRNWDNTALHELMHTFDDIVWTYLGVKLADIVGVKDWDEDVVHGRDPRFKEYQYDGAYSLIQNTLRLALVRRKNRAALSLTERLLIKLRSFVATKRDETILGPLLLQSTK